MKLIVPFKANKFQANETNVTISDNFSKMLCKKSQIKYKIKQIHPSNVYRCHMYTINVQLIADALSNCLSL